MPERRVVFVWNEGSFADQARTAGHCVVTSRAAFTRVRGKSAFRDASYVVLAEWEGDARQLSRYGGLSLLHEFFDSSTAVPRVALCSFLTRVALAELGGERGDGARLMFPFVQLPASIPVLADAADTAPAPSAMVQVWIREHLLSARPFAMWEHNFNRDAHRGAAAFERAVKALQRQIRARRPLLSRTLTDVGAFEDLLTDALRAVQREDERSIDESRKSILETLVGAQVRAGKVGTSSPERYSVLVVEDDDLDRAVVVDGLKNYFSEVTGFQDSGVALAVLQSEGVSTGEGALATRVSAVVSDWDLREGGTTNGFMQRLQGPDFLVEAATHVSGPLVGLTSLPGEIVSAMLNSAPSDVRGRLSWFPKPRTNDLRSFDYHGLAQHILVGIRAAERFWAECPAAAGYAHWSTRGLGRYYVMVRGWRAEEQNAFFAECAARAVTEMRAVTEAAPGRVTPLKINVDSGDRVGAEHSFAKFKDVLCGRLVVLGLYLQRSPSKRNYVRVLGMLRPDMWDEHRPEIGSKSFPNMMSVLGLARKASRIDLERLRLMPHENTWLASEGLVLHPAALTAKEREAASCFAEDAEAIVRKVEKGLRLKQFAIDVRVAEPEEDEEESAEQRDAIEATALLEAAALELREGGSERSERCTLARKQFKVSVLGLANDFGDVFDVLYDRMPELKKRLLDLGRQA